MKRKLLIIYVFLISYLLIAFLLLLVYELWSSYRSKSEYIAPIVTTVTPMQKPTTTKEKQLKIHATIPYWEQEKAVAVFQNNVTRFAYLSLFWYTLDADSTIATYNDAVEDAAIISFAKQNNVKVLALITNLPDFEGSEWDSSRVRAVISTQQQRKAHIDDILTLLNAKGFDGVNIDYEALDDDLRSEFSLFIQELSTELHKQDKLVAVAIHPKTTEYLPAEDNGSRAQDWQEIARHADHMYFMTYGEHWNTSAAGPIASIPWDTNIINYAKSLQVPTQKIFLGTPLYAVRWQEGTRKGEGLLFEDVTLLEQQFNGKPIWNETWKSSVLNYSENGNRYVVHFENAKSVKEKLKLAEQNNLGGMTFWHIGGEDPEVWNIL